VVLDATSLSEEDVDDEQDEADLFSLAMFFGRHSKAVWKRGLIDASRLVGPQEHTPEVLRLATSTEQWMKAAAQNLRAQASASSASSFAAIPCCSSSSFASSCSSTSFGHTSAALGDVFGRQSIPCCLSCAIELLSMRARMLYY
jgi:hypothetical protein